MDQPIYEKIFKTSPLGISLTFCTTPGGYHPAHWHEELELLYPLNGKADMTIENKKFELPKKNIIAVESCQIHSTYAYDKSSMYLCIHTFKETLKNYLPDITLCQIHCILAEISQEQFPEYYKICELLAELTRQYVFDSPSFRLEAEGIVLQAVARLIRFFSIPDTSCLTAANQITIERIRSVIRYVEQHYHETISL